MNGPFGDALREYQDSERSFNTDLINYLAKGYVYSGPEAFIAARTINLEHADKWDDFDFEHKNPNCWFVFLAAGRAKLHRFQQLAPFPLPYIGWHRRTDNNLRTYRWERFATLVKENGINQNKTTRTQG